MGRLVVAEDGGRDASPVGNLQARRLGPVADGGGFLPGVRAAPVLAGHRPRGDCPGICYVFGRSLAETLSVLRAKVNLVRLAVESDRAGLHIFCLAADVTRERYLSESGHRSFIPADPVII